MKAYPIGGREGDDPSDFGLVLVDGSPLDGCVEARKRDLLRIGAGIGHSGRSAASHGLVFRRGLGLQQRKSLLFCYLVRDEGGRSLFFLRRFRGGAVRKACGL